MENKNIFSWDSSVCSTNSVAVENNEFELCIFNDGNLEITNKKNGQKAILRKELISNCSFNRPKLLTKGGFCLIWKPEVCEEIGNVVNQSRGFAVEPNKKDKDAFDKLEIFTLILRNNGVLVV